MGTEFANRTHTLLEQFYSARADDSTALEALLAWLRPHIRQRLQGKGVQGENLEDLCEEAVWRLMESLRRSHTSANLRVSNGLAYALTIADNVFVTFCRHNRPQWYCLKRRVVYVLDNQGARKNLFAHWRMGCEWLGGFAHWRGKTFRETPRYRAFCTHRWEFCNSALNDRDPAHVKLPELLARLFDWVGTPLEVDDATTHIAELQRISDPTHLPLYSTNEKDDEEWEDERLRGPDNVEKEVLDALAGEQLRHALWREIEEMPLRQRIALLLRMERDQLVLLGETLTVIADVLEIPLAEFAALWNSLPLEFEAISERLRCTAQQTFHLRKTARARVMRRLARYAAAS